MKKLILGSVLAVSLGFFATGCSSKTCNTAKVVYPDCVPCTPLAPKPCTPCK